MPVREKWALAAKVREKGAALIDCPVGGTVGPALGGKLFGFAVGDAGVGEAKSQGEAVQFLFEPGPFDFFSSPSQCR